MNNGVDNEDFCGNDIPLPPDAAFVPRSIPWKSSDLLGSLGRIDVTLPSATVSEMKPILWNDLSSEHDAENFCVHLATLKFGFSPEFQTFERVWRRDEWNHYLGFRRIYSILYGEAEESIAVRLAGQPINFGPIEQFLDDEFKICLLLAYDEIATTKSYSADYAVYAEFGNPAFLRWIKAVTRDEAYHYHNAMQVIRYRHAHRIPEIAGVMDEIFAVDLLQREYQGTFVLDHTGPAFNPTFLGECVDLVKNYFKK